jgi:WD40 repeat protein
MLRLLLTSCLIVGTVGVTQAQSERGDAKISGATYNPDGTQVAVQTGTLSCTGDPADSPVLILNVADGSVIHRLEGHICATGGISWNQDGTRLVTSGGDNSVIIWDTVVGQIAAIYGRPGLDGHITSVYAGATWNWVSNQIAFSGGSTVYILAPVTMNVVQELNHSSVARSIAWKPGTTTLAVANRNGEINIWDTASGQRISTLTMSGVSNLSWHPTRDEIAVSNEANVDVIDITTGSVLKTFTGHTDRVLEVAWSPDGTKIASGSDDRTVRVWDAETGELLKLFSYQWYVLALAWSPDSTHLTYGGQQRGDPDNLIEIVALEPVSVIDITEQS